MMRRRALLMDTEPTAYITNGLVLWLDGLDRGDTPGIWKDLISNNDAVLYGTYTELNNGINFPGGSPNGYGQFENHLNISRTVGTIEVCVRLTAFDGTGRPTYCETNGMIGGSIALNAGGSAALRWWNLASGNQLWLAPAINSYYLTASGNNSYGMINGKKANLNTVSSWGTTLTNPRLGNRGQGNPFIGDFYALRIYNRQLSLYEMRNNQKMDNKRFNLGLNI